MKREQKLMCKFSVFCMCAVCPNIDLGRRSYITFSFFYGFRISFQFLWCCFFSFVTFIRNRFPFWTIYYIVCFFGFFFFFLFGFRFFYLFFVFVTIGRYFVGFFSFFSIVINIFGDFFNITIGFFFNFNFDNFFLFNRFLQRYINYNFYC